MMDEYENVMPDDEIDEGYFGEIVIDEAEYSEEGRCRCKFRFLVKLAVWSVVTVVAPFVLYYTADLVAGAFLGPVWFLMMVVSICAAPAVLGCLCWHMSVKDVEFWRWIKERF